MKNALAIIGLVACVMPVAVAATPHFQTGDFQKGIASYYHDSLDGLPTASGEIYRKNRVSAAHKSLPLGTKVRVTDTETGNAITVEINDRGPFVDGRIIDLSRRAAKKLGIIHQGIAKVRLEVLSVPLKKRG